MGKETNKAPKPICNWRMKAIGKTAKISITGVIGDGWEDGVTANQFVADMDALGEVETIVLDIYSPGGSVVEGNRIYNALRKHPAKVVANIDFAASMATVIAMAADEINMAENGWFMIHNPWTVAMGDSDELRVAADRLDAIKEQITAAYVGRTKLNATEIGGLMDEETWMTADYAKEFGFIDNVTPEIAVAAAMTCNLKNIPDEARAFVEPVDATEDDETEDKPAPESAEPTEEPEADETTEPTASAETEGDGDEIDPEVSALADAAYDEGFAAAMAKVDEAVAAKTAKLQAKLVAAEKARESAVAEAKELAGEVEAMQRRIDSIAAGFEYEPENPAVNATELHKHPFFAKLAELKAEGLTDDQARRRIDADNPELRQSLIAAANRK